MPTLFVPILKIPVPLVLGGIEASLRRIAHYDFWSNKVRKSILVDAKADYLLYGMAEQSVLALANCLQQGFRPEICAGSVISPLKCRESALLLPSFAEVATDKDAFARMFTQFYAQNDPITANPSPSSRITVI